MSDDADYGPGKDHPLAAENTSLKKQLDDAHIEIARLRLLLNESSPSVPAQAPYSPPPPPKVAEPTVPFDQQRLPLQAVTPTTSSAKIALFRSLFRGREDVYAQQWQKNGKTDYGPAKHHDWDSHTRKEKGGFNCGPGCLLLPLTDKLIGQHLAGEYTLGVYPLLMDNTCWFLAIDFDKADWQSDVLAFAETCDRHMVPAHIERSRSGNGGHIWIFFERPVPASRARNLGAFLISETKQTRYQLVFSSYDRMFPNQDLMPSGGFGNLIAYPLQKEARSQGNCVFVDRSLRPYENQWQYLSSARSVSAHQHDALVSAASQRDAIFQVP